MKGYLLNVNSTVKCTHLGSATNTTENKKVTVNGHSTVLINTQYKVSSCTLSPKSGGPCTSATWKSGTTRVTSFDKALLFDNSKASTLPPGTPLVISNTQKRVTAI